MAAPQSGCDYTITINTSSVNTSASGVKKMRVIATPNVRLKSVPDYSGISNIELAKALQYDLSLVSRYLGGLRVFEAASAQMGSIADYWLSRANRTQDIDWLKVRFASASLPTGVSTRYQLKQC